MRTQNETEALARQIMELARDILLVKLRFLDVAIHHLTLAPDYGGLATDGSTLFFDAKHVLRGFKAERTAVTREYLHVVLHCVFRHMLVDPSVDRGLWDLACDMAVEGILEELGLDCITSARQERQAKVSQKLRGEVAPFTAEKLYQVYAGCSARQRQKMGR